MNAASVTRLLHLYPIARVLAYSFLFAHCPVLAVRSACAVSRPFLASQMDCEIRARAALTVSEQTRP